MSVTFLQIDNDRRRAGVRVHALCMAAGVTVGQYYRAASGKRKLRARTLERLRRALLSGPKAKTQGVRVNAMLLRAAYRGYVACLLAEGPDGPSLEAVLAADPARKATADPAWAAAAKIRALAVYCTVVEFDLPAARVAAAIGVTRAAASEMLKRVEDLRDDPALDALVERAGRMISGRTG